MWPRASPSFGPPLPPHSSLSCVEFVVSDPPAICLLWAAMPVACELRLGVSELGPVPYKRLCSEFIKQPRERGKGGGLLCKIFNRVLQGEEFTLLNPVDLEELLTLQTVVIKTHPDDTYNI